MNSVQVSAIDAPISSSVPQMIDKGQAYYWSYAWQSGEREARAEIQAGDTRTFDTADDAIRWLLSDED